MLSNQIVGAIGVVKTVTQDGDPEVEFDGDCIALNKGALAKVMILSICFVFDYQICDTA